jgi:hypothetical protein
MEILPGFLVFVLVIFFTIFLSLNNPSISRILLIALVIRIFFLLAGNYFITLPDSIADAITFENNAWILSQQGFFSLIINFSGPSNDFLSWLIAIPYSLFGRSILLAKSISLFFGICNVYLGWKIGKQIWGNQTAIKVAWLIALFPTLILYSVLVMREVYVCFFLLIALGGIINWFKTKSIKFFIISLLGFCGATFFHGAMIVGGILFIIVVGLISLKKIIRSIFTNFIKPIYIFYFIFFLATSGLYFNNQIKTPKLGYFENSIKLDNLLRKTKKSTRGDASYPEWTKINSPIELIYKVPIRTLYFLFSPFPFDLSKPKHIIGMLDSFLYTYLLFLIFLNRKEIWKNPALKMFLLVLLCYVILFSIGVGNFGTALRHRSKFVVILILLAAPLIKKFTLNKR